MRMSPIIVRPVRTYFGWNPRVQKEILRPKLDKARPALLYSGAMHISQPGISINGGILDPDKKFMVMVVHQII